MYKIMFIVLLKIHHKLIKLEVETELLAKQRRTHLLKIFPINLSIKEAISLQPRVNIEL